MFQVVEIATGYVVGTYQTRQAARRAKDRKDNAYGAYAYRVVEYCAQ